MMYIPDNRHFREFMEKKDDDVLLREPETCKKCKRVFMSLYPLGKCGDHDALEAIK